MLRLYESAMKTATRPGDVEFIFRIDDDDFDSRAMVEHLQDGGGKVVAVSGGRNDFSGMWEECVPRCKGNYFVFGADDLIFRTSGWDKSIKESVPYPRVTPALIFVDDGNPLVHRATHPILTRRWVNLFGFVPSGYQVDYCDTHIWDTAQRLEALGHRCIVKKSDILIEHMHVSIGKAKMDDTYSERKKIGAQNVKVVYEERAAERQDKVEQIHRLLTWTPNKNPGSVVLVGHGLFDKNNYTGSWIDGQDTVVRFNQFAIPGYERWVGRKTDIWCWITNPNTAKPAPGPFRHVWMINPFENLENRDYFENLACGKPLTEIGPKPYMESSLSIGYPSRQPRPSCGAVALYWALKIWEPPIYVTGFRGFRQDEQLHYFDNRSVPEGFHNEAFERPWLDSLRQKNLIRDVV